MVRAKHASLLSLLAIVTLLLETAGSAWGQAEKGKAPVTRPPANAETAAPPADSLASAFGDTEAAEEATGPAGTPNMFGDSFHRGLTLFAQDMFAEASTNIPLAGGCRRVKICENNSPLPQDRVYFLYNHFANAMQADASTFLVGPASRSFDLDRYSLGFEKVFGDGSWSYEIRMPFCGGMEFDTPNFSVRGGQVGNLAVILKKRVFQSETTAVAVGLGVDTPTGDDAHGHVNLTEYTLRNQAVHLLPYAGVVHAPCCSRVFWMGFLQIDIPTTGNRLDYVDHYSASSGSFGSLCDQTLLYADLSVGYWLHRNPCASFLTGLAPVLELHYTTALQDADTVSGYVLPTNFTFTSVPNRFDEVNFTVGLHIEMCNNTLCRVAGVFPLGTGLNRSFDSEVQVQLERRF